MRVQYNLGQKIKKTSTNTNLLQKITRPTFIAVAVALLGIGAVAGNNFMLQASRANAVQGVASNGARLTIMSPSADAYLPDNVRIAASLGTMPADSYHMFWYVDNGSWNWMSNSNTVAGTKQTDINVKGWKWHAPSNRYVIDVVAVIVATGERVYASVPINVATAPVTAATPAVSVSTSAPAPTAAPTSAPTTTAAPAAPVTPATATASLPTNLYVKPDNNAARTAASTTNPITKRVMTRLAGMPAATWIGDWNSNVQGDVSSVVNAAAAAGQTPVFVAYNIPGRDCGSYSAGGANSVANYQTWIRGFAAGIGNRSAIVILEPDALAQMDCLNTADKTARYQLLNYAITTLKANTATKVYVDGGHANWIGAKDMANRLKTAGVAASDGFSLNVSNFISTADSAAYGRKVSADIGNKHFVIDTSRSGNGANGEWCNPAGRALGAAPTAQTGDALIDYLLWIKAPGESDGTCNGGPSAGQWWPSYAEALAVNAGW